MVVLRDSDSSRCGCLEDLEETESGVIDRLFRPHPCRNGSDSEAVYRRTHKARTLLVMESVGCAEGTDPHKHDNVHAGWNSGRPAMEMARAVGRCGVECFYRDPTASDGQRPV